MNLLSYQTLVESPFIIVNIGGYTFGHCSKVEYRSRLGETMKVTYPNFMQSLNAIKINGTVNTYTIKMVYAIKQGDDPNLLEKVFSSVSSDRKITISYGDWESPSFIYKEEVALITKVQSDVNFSGSTITYTISCVSQTLALKSGKFDFPMRVAKPSDVIKSLLKNRKYGLKDIFYGMKDMQSIKKYGLIEGDDKMVVIEAKHGVTTLDYLNYLVNCMRPSSDTSDDPVQGARYYLSIVDDIRNAFGGPYFKVVRIDADAKVVDHDTYEVDVGYPGNNFVQSFSLTDNEQWSILYNYSKSLGHSDYVYKIDNQGNMTTEYSPNITTSNQLMKTTAADRAWWTKVTQFPKTATLVIKGLVRPSILMSNVKINVYFYGQKYIASGTYIITRQSDTVDANGYRTELTLTRIRGDDL